MLITDSRTYFVNRGGDLRPSPFQAFTPFPTMHETDPHKQMASALGRIPSGLFVITITHAGQSTGMLASWVQQCSFNPPQLSFALQRQRPVIAWLDDGAPFVVNILDETQTDVIAHFGRGFDLATPAFTGLGTTPATHGAPILDEALAYLECTVVGRHSTGDHDLLIGQVDGGRLLGEGQPMVHIRKNGLHY